ncbi:thermonuclease family protein (plasmid) [Rossellomorea sp. AcN35-11]|nr:thermonuclease family protein [Rossellomorea sp. AcN35-11]
MKKIMFSLALILPLATCSQTEVNDAVNNISSIADKTEDVIEAGQEFKDGLEDIREGLSKFEGFTKGSELASDRSFSATVSHVTDGDTIKISPNDFERYVEVAGLNSESEPTIRILNIDTPEVHGPKAVQKFGPEASAYAKKTLSGQQVTIELSEKESPYDDYGRLLAYVWVGDTLYEEMIVREGLARVAYLYEPDTKYANHLRSVESEAEFNEINIWETDGYVTDDGFDMSVYQ